MYKTFKLLTGFLMIALMISSGPAYAQDTLEGELSIIGSNTVFPIVAEAQARWGELHPDVQFSTEGPGSGAGFDALLDGTADIAPMSRAPKENELKEASDNGQDIEQLIVARDALIVVIPNENPINDLTQDQVSSIYNGSVRDWKDVIPNDDDSRFDYMADTTIRVVERDQDSGTHDFFNDFFIGGNEVPASDFGQYYAQYAGTGDLFSDVSENENAIGYGGLAYLDNSVKAVDIDRIEANKENAGDGSYPVTRPLFLVWDKNDETENPLIKEFTDYIMSPEGQYIADSVGYIAVEPMTTGYTEVAGQEETPVAFLPFLIAISALSLFFRRRN